jgi:hypothetical protein
MILPTRKLRPEDSLVYVGGRVLSLLDEPKTVSRLWEEFNHQQQAQPTVPKWSVTYDWFILSLDLLFLMSALDLAEGRLNRRRQ